MLEAIFSYLWQALSATVFQILILFGPGLLLTLILNFETRFIQNRYVNLMGRSIYLLLFGWLGTVVHELGHAIFCIIFGHKITEIKLFQPDTETGTLGYVKHSYNPGNIYQLAGNFFIGIGPILLGSAIIFLLSHWLLGMNLFNQGQYSMTYQVNSWNEFERLLRTLGSNSGHLFIDIFSRQNLTGWQLYVFLYLAFAIGSSITLSPPDIKSAFRGFIVIATLILVLNLATVWAGNYISAAMVKFTGYYALFYAMVFLIIVINAVIALSILLPLSLLKRAHSKAA